MASELPKIDASEVTMFFDFWEDALEICKLWSWGENVEARGAICDPGLLEAGKIGVSKLCWAGTVLKALFPPVGTGAAGIPPAVRSTINGIPPEYEKNNWSLKQHFLIL